MKIKVLALLTAAVLMLGVFAGCQSSELRAYSDEDPAGTEPTGNEDAADKTERDYGPVYESYEPDTVMMTINGIEVTWAELFYWYYYDVSSLEAYFGEITDWDAAPAFDETTTYREYVTSNALDTLKQYCALASKAGDMGVSLDEEDLAAIDEAWAASVESYGEGDEAAFIEYLESLFLSESLYRHINEVHALYTKVFEEIYGPNGEKLDETEVLAKAEDEGYMRAKHVLFRTTNDSGEALTEEEIAQKKADAEAVQAELAAITDPAALEARMDELIAEKSEDTGSSYYPDGYTFLPGEMVEPFETAVSGLENGGLSGVVESTHGYHVILRLPLSPQVIVQVVSEDQTHSLAYVVAQRLYGEATTAWADESEVVFTKEYEEMDIAALFAKAETRTVPTQE